MKTTHLFLILSILSISQLAYAGSDSDSKKPSEDRGKFNHGLRKRKDDLSGRRSICNKPNKPATTNQRISPEAKAILTRTYNQSFYASEEEITRIMEATGLARKKISTWFINKRARDPKSHQKRKQYFLNKNNQSAAAATQRVNTNNSSNNNNNNNNNNYISSDSNSSLVSNVQLPIVAQGPAPEHVQEIMNEISNFRPIQLLVTPAQTCRDLEAPSPDISNFATDDELGL